VKPETTGHIETAGRNRDIAWEILRNSRSAGLQPPPFEWVAVVAFCSAVHYANAYIWEVHGQAFRHSKRRQFIAMNTPLASFLTEHIQMEDHAYFARYTPGHRLYAQDARDLLGLNLAKIEATVRNALDITPP
jgi:hypothetical protein